MGTESHHLMINKPVLLFQLPFAQFASSLDATTLSLELWPTPLAGSTRISLRDSNLRERQNLRNSTNKRRPRLLYGKRPKKLVKENLQRSMKFFPHQDTKK